MRFSITSLSTADTARTARRGKTRGVLASLCLVSTGTLLTGADAVAQTAPQPALQTPSITRSIAKRADLSVPQHEVVILRVEVPPGVEAGWHTHPGEEAAYVTEGEVTLQIAGQAPRKYVTGEAFVVPAGVVHNGIGHASATTKLVSMLITEKGKPLSTPATAPAQ